MEVVGDGVLVDLGDRALLRAKGTGEVAEVVDGERDVRGEGLADGLAVVPGLGDGDLLEVLLDAIGDAEQDQRTLGDGGLAPGRCGGVGGVEGEVDILGGRAGDLAEHLAVDGDGFSKYWPLTGGTHLPPIQFS